MNGWLKGLTDGYNLNATNKRSFIDFYLLNSHGDMDDLSHLINQTTISYSKHVLEDIPHRCTGSVRVTDDVMDIFFSQDTWTSFYQGFIRIAKTYFFNFKLD